MAPPIIPNGPKKAPALQPNMHPHAVPPTVAMVLTIDLESKVLAQDYPQRLSRIRPHWVKLSRSKAEGGGGVNEIIYSSMSRKN